MVTGGGGANMPVAIGVNGAGGFGPVPSFSAMPVRRVARDQDSKEPKVGLEGSKRRQG